jgi:proline dehydrogenase
LILRNFSRSIARQPWIRKAAVSTPLIRDLAWRFIGGETLEAGIATARALRARGISTTINHVGTHVRSASAAVAATEVAIASVRRIAGERLDCYLSLKLTQLGLDVDEALCAAQLHRVLDAAAHAAVFVRLDMEESRYVEPTLRLFDAVRAAYGADAVGIVLQSYLRHRPDDLAREAAAGSRIRLVKGGYWEPAEVVWRRRDEVDGAFLAQAGYLLRHGRRPALATHDPRAIARIRSIAAALGLEQDAFEFQLLHGVREDLQDALVREGYRVRSYVPFGEQWYEYALGCIRRLPGGALDRLTERFRGSEAP